MTTRIIAGTVGVYLTAYSGIGLHIAIPVQLPAFGQAANDPQWAAG